jgi:hypothetical protein
VFAFGAGDWPVLGFLGHSEKQRFRLGGRNPRCTFNLLREWLHRSYHDIEPGSFNERLLQAGVSSDHANESITTRPSDMRAIAINPTNGNIAMAETCGLSNCKVEVFVAGSSGNLSPPRSFVYDDAFGLAFDASGNLWVSASERLLRYAPASSTPDITISRSLTG